MEKYSREKSHNTKKNPENLHAKFEREDLYEQGLFEGGAFFRTRAFLIK